MRGLHRMTSYRLAAWTGCALLGISIALPAYAEQQNTRCSLPAAHTAEPAVKRSVDSDDLVRLRDFGSFGVSVTSEPFEVAPDGKLLALQMRQGDAIFNSYCTAIVLVSTNRHQHPVVIDDGGKVVPAYSNAYGVAEVPKGVPKITQMRWSPDSRSLAYTKNYSDHSELWRFDVGTNALKRLATSAVDIEALAWSPDGSTLLYSSRPGRIEALEKIKAEGRVGYRYDERFRPLYGDRPMISASVPLINQAIDAIDGKPSSFPSGGRASLDVTAGWPERAVAYASSKFHRSVAWSAPSGDVYRSKPTLNVRMDGRAVACNSVACTNVQAVWWSDNGRTLFFERRAGVADSRTELYAWKPGLTAPRALLRTTDAIFGCKLIHEELICAAETSTRPRYLEVISTRDGNRYPLFDPNPEFSTLLLGKVRRLEWSNAFGISTFGDLVLPPGVEHGRRLPLVIVQYESRGFLRGGTGDEYPIQALAARGFAVLSFNRPPWFGYTQSPRNQQEFNNLNARNFADRNSNLSSLEMIISQLDREGVIDPKKVAITGLSDGAVTATFALANSSLFSTAILSTCCEGPFGFEIAGSAIDDAYIESGYPPTRAAGNEFWRHGSLEAAPSAKIVPLLIQAASAEYRMSLGTVRELSHRRWPIEMYIYPDEGHVKIEPKHRWAIYRRNMQWLDFWFNNRRSADPVDTSQYERWDALRHSIQD